MDKKNTSKIILILLIIVGAVIARFGWSLFMENMMKKGMAERSVAPVKVGAVEEAAIKESIDAPARIVAKYKVNLVARVDGFLQKSYFKEGDYVKAGQTLFLIEPNGYSIQASKANANVQYAQAQLVQSQKNYNRAKELVKLDYIAKYSYDEALANRDVAAANVRAQRAALADAGRSLAYTRVKAPFSGRVGLINVTQGNYVSTADGALATLVSMDPIYVTFPIDSKRFGELKSNDAKTKKSERRVELFLANGEKYQYSGVENFYDNTIDETTGTITLRATFKNPEGRLIPGDFANIKMYENYTVKRPVIPMKAVLQDPTGYYVFKVSNKKTALVQRIKVGEQTGSNWTVLEGLNVGEEIIIDGLSKVMPDRPVKVLADSEQIPNEEQKSSK